MTKKPDYKFTKAHTASGSLYTLTIYTGIEEEYEGIGKTFKEAVDNALLAYGEKIKGLDLVVKAADRALDNIDAYQAEDIIAQYNRVTGKRYCKYCGGIIEGPKRKRFCCDKCSLKYFREKANAHKDKKEIR